MKPFGIHITVAFLFIFLMGNASLYSQDDDNTLPKANDSYSKNKFADAEADYRISQSKMPSNVVAPYNLGNSIYRQNQAGEAKYAYMNSLKNKKSTRAQKHWAYHNLGNAFMKEKNYSAAVEAYKNALRNNPTDDKTRYNYALAKEMLKNNPPPPPKDDKNKDKNKDNKDNKDKDKDKKDKDNKDKDKDNKDKDNKDKDNKNDKNDKNNQQDQQKPKPGGIPKERLEDLLNAVNNEEKKVQDKVNAQKVKGKPIGTEKDW